MLSEQQYHSESDKHLKKFKNRGLEPGIINNDMLQRLITEQGPKGEAARLCRNIPIDYKNITVLQLEFQNLLKIDYLWILPNLEKLSLKCNKLNKIENLEKLINLRELDLSFNHIEVIQNLDCLTKLEFLSLFRNKIRKLENVDSLQSLVRLSVGHNLIDTFDGIERLRFMKNLYTLNLEANPISIGQEKGVPFRIYIAAFFPNLKYYNYIVISDDEREQGQKHFRSDLRMLEQKEKEEIGQFELDLAERQNEKHTQRCFVENLNENKIFELIFGSKENNQMFADIESECGYASKDIRNKMIAIAHEICEMAGNKYEMRCKEITEFKEALQCGQKEAQAEEIKLVEAYQKEQNEIFTEVKSLLHALCIEQELGDPHKIEICNEKFDASCDKVWYAIMDTEISLHERSDEAIKSFGRIAKEMMNEFVESAQILFMNLRNICDEYFDKLLECVLNSSSSTENIPENIRKHFSNTETAEEFISKYHNQLKENLSNRLNDLTLTTIQWTTQLIEEYEKKEFERNRSKIHEFNIFLDGQRTAYATVKENLVKELNLFDYFK